MTTTPSIAARRGRPVTGPRRGEVMAGDYDAITHQQSQRPDEHRAASWAASLTVARLRRAGLAR